MRISGIILVVFVLLIGTAFDPPSQFIYPMKGYYTLAGTFGELRTDHFHGGIDIKTNRKIGIPIRAVTDGNLYRVMTKTYGFGNAVYLRHTDGTFTAYAHLSRFTEEVEAYIYTAQKATERFSQNLFPEADRFPVKQGDIIGYSGNSGSSYGPHLHFEWRDSLDRPMNSLLPFLGEIADKTPPILQHIAFEPITQDSRVKGSFERKEWVALGEKGKYRVSDTVFVEGKVGLSYRAFDRLEGAPNKCGVNNVRVFLDDSLLFEQNLTYFSFDDTRQINVHMDYAEWKRSGRRFVRGFVEPGNRLDMYPVSQEKGVLTLPDSKAHTLRLELEDAHGNTSICPLIIRQKAVAPKAGRMDELFEAAVTRGVLHVKCAKKDAKLVLRSPSGIRDLDAQYIYDGGEKGYVIPLSDGDMPDMIWDEAGDWRWVTDFRAELFPHRHHTVDVQEAKLFFPMGSLFQPEALRVRTSAAARSALSATYEVGNSATPLRERFTISFAPLEGLKGLVVATKDKRGRWEFAGNSLLEDGRIAAEVKHFGAFALMQDTDAPTLKPINFVPKTKLKAGTNSLRLKATDAFSDIDDYNAKAWLDDEFALIRYNFKRNEFIHSFREPLSAGKHTFRIRVADGAGNVQEQTFEIVK